MVVVIPAKLSAMDFGELEIVFDAVVMGEGRVCSGVRLSAFV